MTANLGKCLLRTCQRHSDLKKVSHEFTILFFIDLFKNFTRAKNYRNWHKLKSVSIVIRAILFEFKFVIISAISIGNIRIFIHF